MIKKISIVILFTLFLINGCVESPTAVGSSLLPAYDKFEVKVAKTDTLNIERKSLTFTKKLDLGPAPRVLIGKFNGLTSTALIRFYILLPDSVKNALNSDSLNVKSAWVEIQPNYYLGDKSLPFNFHVYKVNNFWIPEDYDADSLNALNYDQTPVSVLDNPADSVLKFSLPQNLAYDWVKKSTDSEHPENNGVMLKPDEGTQRIIGFQGITSIRFPDEPVLKIIVEKPGSFQDTLTENITSDVHVITGQPNIKNVSNINLLSNYSMRGYYYFDDSFLPKDAIINKAVFTLSIDSTASWEGSAPTDSVVVQMAADSLNKDSTVSSAQIHLARVGWTFSGNISFFVQKWINGTANEGLILRTTDEDRSLNLISLFSEKAADKSKRPVLEIYYTDKK